ncbi:hypothetical protein ACN38_g5194 [Penicillium nordicum]|uniref:Uncharacterized protein n=1 Tax=Penicillium nordicum TaxID=229535 RepID=A0A0M8P5F1_9EURO|nr:hypothetical protein ACN38_g5194 [Penicillium nordicum]
MASWPGFIRDRLSRPPSMADCYTTTRSEVCLPNISFTTTPWLKELQGGARVSTSTASEILKRSSPLPSGASAPRTASTAPIFEFSELDLVDKDYETTENEPWSPQNLRKWDEYDHSTESSVPSFQFQYPREIDEPTNWYNMLAPPPESAHDTSAKVGELIVQVLNAHEDVLAKRYQIREMRHMLRQKRDEEDDVRLVLQSKLNLITAENVHEDVAAINHTINDLQVATASYFVLENEYHRQEDELAQLEYHYNGHLERLQTIFKYQRGLLAQLEPITSDTESSSAEFSSDDGEETLPQAADYFSMVDEARILMERLSELETEYLFLVDQRELRERVGIPLDRAALNFLLSYQDERTKIETELALARHKVDSHPEHTNRSVQITEEEDNKDEEEEEEEEVMQHFMPEKPEDQTYNDPLHSSEFEDSSPFFASAHSQAVNKGSFVNRWLLHRLRHSRVEIMRFKSTPELVDLGSKGWGSDNISQMAMMLWFQEGAASVEHIRSQ